MTDLGAYLDFELPPPAASWREHWGGMPAFTQGTVRPYRSLDVRFRTPEDALAFAQLLDQHGRWSMKCSRRVRPFLWGPAADAYARSHATWVAPPEGPAPPQYPIYIVSKGRATTQFTSRALDDMGVPHFIVVERQEEAQYKANAVRSATVIVLDPLYQERYDTLDDLGATRSRGSGPARNFAWEHALGNGAARYWCVDDNITGFWRLHRNRKVRVRTGGILRAMEAFCERYTNVLMAGPHYEMFVTRRDEHPPYILNSRVYSCNLIRTDAPYRWSGRYNEDTILSLRMLKDDYVTVLFNAFLQNKMGTQQLKGGNTTELYGGGTAPKSEMLWRVMRDLGLGDAAGRGQKGKSSNVKRWGRDHHFIDYSRFRQTLQLRPGVTIPAAEDPFGMVLRSEPKAHAVIMKPIRMRWAQVGTDYTPRVIRVHFTNAEELAAFRAMTGTPESDQDEIWYPATAAAGLLAEPEAPMPELDEEDDVEMDDDPDEEDV